MKLNKQNQAQIYFADCVDIFSDLKLDSKLQVTRLLTASTAGNNVGNNFNVPLKNRNLNFSSRKLQ